MKQSGYTSVIIYVVFGFSLMYILNYKRVKYSNKIQKLILYINDDCYHIHHYITSAFTILFILLGYTLRDKPKIWIINVISLLIGVALEDFLYKDWNIIKKNNCNIN